MKKLVYIAILASIFYACNKDCENNNETFYVYSSDLPFIIPYADTSRVKFIKNGTDTLTFISQGLKETYFDGYISNTQSGGCGTNAKYQQNSLKMRYSDNDFFEIFVNPNEFEYRNIGLNVNKTNGKFTSTQFKSIYPLPIINYTINNLKYDSVKVLLFSNSDSIIFKRKVGILKMTISNDLYEIVK